MSHYIQCAPYRRLFSLVAPLLALCLTAGGQQLADAAKVSPGKGKTDKAVPGKTAADKDAKPDTPPATDSNPEYSVGEGDVLHIDVWQEAEVSQNVVVRPDGNISLPLINEVKVSGMTPLEIQGLVAEKLKSFVNQPKVTVTVTEVRSKRAYISGEVTRPGEYPLNTKVTVLQMIAQAGGFTPFAKTENIVIIRITNGTEQRLRFHYKEVLHGKNTEQNIALQPGDTVIVP
jgi:polysaccharide export outer membrane protein